MRKSRSPNSGLEIRYERRRGAIVAFLVRGHAGFEVSGRDLVCAAASALVLSAAHGLREHCGQRPKISDMRAQFRVDLQSGGNAQAQAVLETMLSGLEAIAGSYPGHVRIARGRLPATGPRARRAKSKPSRAR